jgi:hypothetical protein
MDLFQPNEIIASGRIQLSGLSREALVGMEGWLAGALAPDWGVEELRAAVDANEGVMIGDEKGEAIGVAVVVVDAPVKGAVMVPFLAIEPSRRFRGLGGEAGLALERHVRQRLGVERVYAPAPDGRGLAVYFWLRLGYRPLTQSEAPGPVVGLSGEEMRGMWMVREGVAGGSS